ncbi:ABC transporter permease [Yinghuangia seranimata]|uniref:ABC transporter permease n=1 Tax=Yinghuangia seranimata TaxID=408067 RepID=UPI00248C507C|nr:ABC transporter permease [Yinghuangia seranimata]MDI2129194.1 ABC transporter permease [Yinghuangia seranimata]
MRWLRRNLVVIAGLATLVYSIAPNIVVIVFSFNDPAGKYNFEWDHFSTKAWTDPCGVAGMCDSVQLSFKIAILATVFATVLGTLVAFALARYRFRARGFVNSMIFLPMAMPEIVMAASIGMLFLSIGMEAGFTTILLAHITFCISFVVTAVKARVLGMDATLEEAAKDLYATPVQVFLRVTLPLAAPGIAAGAMLAFALSFDDFIITNFNAGPDTVTFPMYVWGASQRGTPPQINVIGSAMLIISVLVVLGSQLLGRRNRVKA